MVDISHKYVKKIVGEAFERKKFKEGQVRFPTSSPNDPQMQRIANIIAQAKGVPVQDIWNEVNEAVQQQQKFASVAPILYHTLQQNVVENELFFQFEKTNVPSNAPRFSNITFQKLVRSIRADQDEFYPLRSYIDKRRLVNPKFTFDYTAPNDTKSEQRNQTASKFRVPTAAATPNGEFIFNVPFMQKLMDYANVKGIKPKGKKYFSNGGDIPDEYAYIEFVIMHEFMHYSNDDFYYQKIIPNANPTIINWVGDFRSNYLLTKSGYEPLPIGLFNDKINYDRQKSYMEMYDLVKSEFDKLKEEFKDQIKKAMDQLSDDHAPGQEQGQGEEVPDGTTIGDMDENGKKIQKEVEGGKDKAPGERGKEADKDRSLQKDSQPGNQQNQGTQDVDYRQIAPKFNWKQLVHRFIMTAKPRMEETYSKPHRRSVTGTHIISQVGAAAIKPAERPQDFVDSKLAFVIDSSGSMSGIIGQIFSDAVNLLRQPAFAKTEQTVIKFSGGYEIYKVNFASNKAGKVNAAMEKPKKYDMKTSDVFSQHFGAGTVFDSATANEVISLVNTKHNVIIFEDSDILHGDNYTNFLNVIKAGPSHVFVIFDSRETYLAFRQKSGISTANITYFS